MYSADVVNAVFGYLKIMYYYGIVIMLVDLDFNLLFVYIGNFKYYYFNCLYEIKLYFKYI